MIYTEQADVAHLLRLLALKRHPPRPRLCHSLGEMERKRLHTSPFFILSFFPLIYLNRFTIVVSIHRPSVRERGREGGSSGGSLRVWKVPVSPVGRSRGLCVFIVIYMKGPLCIYCYIHEGAPVYLL